ncbi:isoprenylcysteine carboxylmethyltransferase family protein [Sulfitobacter sp. S190]|nr:isoprenylcysteine carboxylmethyltransferase family protein [Sulfitobacter sp. S190]
MPPVWLAGALVLVWAVARVTSPDSPHPAAMLVGAVLVGAGVALMVAAIAAFRRHDTTVVPHQTPDALITDGIFAWTRNPIYLGDVLVLAGAVCGWAAWAAVPVIPAFIWIVQRRFIAPEEARMKQSFGAAFAAYVEKTGRWV